MLHAGLVDEISHVTVPVADGGVGISSFFDIPGDPPPKSAATLRLLSRKQLPGSVTWLRYRVVVKHTRCPIQPNHQAPCQQIPHEKPNRLGLYDEIADLPRVEAPTQWQIGPLSPATSPHTQKPKRSREPTAVEGVPPLRLGLTEISWLEGDFDFLSAVA